MTVRLPQFDGPDPAHTLEIGHQLFGRAHLHGTQVGPYPHRPRQIADLHVEAARADGRWDKAYRVSTDEVPADLMAAIDAEPHARAMFDVLTAQNRFALIFRLGQIRTEAGRNRKIADITAMLARGETFHPQKARP